VSEEGIGRIGYYLKPGLAVSLQEESGEALAATIKALSPRSISLKLARPTPEPSFQTGDRVWMKYWDEGATVYRWETRVAEIQGPENQKARNLANSLLNTSFFLEPVNGFITNYIRHHCHAGPVGHGS